MDGATTVQTAITRLAGLLPRLYHVSGDGLEAPVGTAILLRAGVANRCGIREPKVRFERLVADRRRRLETWNELGTAGPDEDGIASFSYETTGEARQRLRAVLLDGDKAVGYPVYFTVSPEQARNGDTVVPAARARAVGINQVAEHVKRTIVTFRDAEFDTDKLFAPGGDNTALQATRAGTYLVTGEVEWDQNNSGTGYRGAEIMLRGGTAAHVLSAPLPSGVFTIQEVTTIVRMDTGERVQLAATQSSGNRVIITGATLSLAWLGP
jgi:hypothetical protein